MGTCPAGTDVPIFYHCEPDSALRDNGALEGASGAFAKDDEVIVQCEILDSTTYEPLYIMGFVDKPKGCCFSIKIVRDDGVIIDEDLINSIEVFLDDTESPPILYVYNMRESYEDSGDEALNEKFEDGFYNLTPEGVRKNKRYNPDTEYWTFDGYQRPVSWMWGATETDDLTKPTSPPCGGYAKKWNGSEYIEQVTEGYYIRIVYTNGLSCIYRVLTKIEKDAGQLSRGYGYQDDSLVYHDEVTTYMVEDNLVKPGRFIFQVPYIRKVTTDSYPEDGYYYYSFRCLEGDPLDCEDVDDIDYGKPYFYIPCLQGMYYYSMDTDFWKNHKIISSVPYSLHGQIEHSLHLGYDDDPPYDYGSTYCPNLKTISTTISGAGVSLGYTTGDENDKIEVNTNYSRTFNPVDITEDFLPIPEGELNEQTYGISMNITGGLHRVGIGREFATCFSMYTSARDENA